MLVGNGPSVAVAQEAAPTGSAPLTLTDCYRMALKQSEAIAIRRELIEESQARFTQALSGVLPRVSFSSTDKRQDGNGSSAFTRRELPERKFIFTQPLFSGFKEFAAMASTQAEQRQRTYEKVRAEQLLFVDVADAFTLFLEEQEDLGVLEAIEGVLVERIDELKVREQLGRSRSSEVVSVEAQLYRLRAEVELLQSRKTVARQLLEFLTGRQRIEAVVDSDPFPPPVDDEEQYLSKSLSRADVHAAQEAALAAQKEIRIAQADFWPDVNLEGNYFLERSGAAKEVEWDAALKVEVPIFQGGQTAGAVRQASSQAAQAQLKLNEIRRRVVQEIRDAYTHLRAAIGRYFALEKALESTELAYRFHVEEYRLNLVSNLEALQSLQTFQDARRDLIHAHYEVKRLYWQLKAAAGEIEP